MHRLAVSGFYWQTGNNTAAQSLHLRFAPPACAGQQIASVYCADGSLADKQAGSHMHTTMALHPSAGHAEA